MKLFVLVADCELRGVVGRQQQIDEASLTGVAVISISVSHLKTWQDSSDVSNARSAFIQAALKYMMVTVTVCNSRTVDSNH